MNFIQKAQCILFCVRQCFMPGFMPDCGRREMVEVMSVNGTINKMELAFTKAR